MREEFRQGVLEFVVLEFVGMKGIGAGQPPRLRVVALVGGRDQENTIRMQQSSGFAEERMPVVKMLDDFERRDQMKSPIRERECGGGGGDKVDVRKRISGARMRGRVRR